MGFIGISHLEAIRRIGFSELHAVADVNYELAKKKADEYGIPKCCKTIDELIKDPDIEIIHNCTPNNMHCEINKKIIENGKHVFSEKPLGISSKESKEMLTLVSRNPDLVHAVNFLYRMNPLVQDIKNRIQAGEIGTPQIVHGSYLQDWLLYDTDYNWRIEPEISGPSRCMADIGSHWMDTVQTVLNSKIVEVCADLATIIPVRKKPKGQMETFSLNKNMEYEEKKVSTEDYGAVLVRFANGTRGLFCASQVSAGRRCYLNFEVNGSKASYCWNQESADHMWIGRRDAHNSLVHRNPNLMSEEAKQYTYLAAGHPEGWNDAMRNNVYAVHKFIIEGKKIGKDNADFATFHDGYYINLLTDAILESSMTKSWVRVSDERL